MNKFNKRETIALTRGVFAYLGIKECKGEEVSVIVSMDGNFEIFPSEKDKFIKDLRKVIEKYQIFYMK